ncbi:MAG TPA: YsnF/AvaK domain-containing protein [Bryobacteraceae bacterium]|nr:YsnF/AvaK domain-containing protein [Bryobacteraceae bacterium]
MNTRTTLVAVFRDSASAERARQELTSAGFAASDIDHRSSTHFASDAATGNTGITGATPASHSSGGGIGGWFRSMFGGDDDRDTMSYSSAIESGGVALTVQTDDAQVDRAAEILNRNGAIDVDEQDTGLNTGTTSTHSTAGASLADNVSGRGLDTDRAGHVIPIVEEELAVGKRAVRRGGVRIVSRVQETPVEEQVSLRDETVRVTRTAVDRPASEADFTAVAGGAIEMTEVDEEAVVSKQARVVEEIIVGKETTERTETVRDTVRRTDVEVEDLGSDVTKTRKG